MIEKALELLKDKKNELDNEKKVQEETKADCSGKKDKSDIEEIEKTLERLKKKSSKRVLRLSKNGRELTDKEIEEVTQSEKKILKYKKQKEIKKKNEESTTNCNNPGTQSLVGAERQELPELNLKINKKTGEVVLTDETVDDKGKKIEYRSKMDSEHYTKKRLKNLSEYIEEIFKISNEDKKYLKNIDPTIFRAYAEYDTKNKGKYNASPTKMYVESVINRAKEIETGEKNDGIKMPGSVEVDIGWHLFQKNSREKNASRFSIKKLFESNRANKILKNHGKVGFFREKMGLATIKDNRKVFVGLATFLAAVGISSTGLIDNSPKTQDNSNTKVENEDLNEKIDFENIAQNSYIDKKISFENLAINPYITNESEKQEVVNVENNQIEQKSRIYVGDIVDCDGLLYNSYDVEESSGALISRRAGVNKISVVINSEVFSTANGKYTADEIYDMAENAGVNVNYHIDKVQVINGKEYVEVKEVDNVSPTYIYNDNGVARYSDGREFSGDVKCGYGWMHQDEIKKSENMNDIERTDNVKSVLIENDNIMTR